MIDVGRLNKRITFLAYNDTTDKIGQTVQVLSPYKTVWGSVEPLKGKELQEVQKTMNELTHKIFTRYLKDVNEDMLIEFKGRRFKITAIINRNEDNELLQFTCVEERQGKMEG